jgi:predicted Mrr-cat superfamily restriction endonuclease
MQLFVAQSQIGSHNRIKDFLNDCYICLYSPGIGDLEQTDQARWMQRLIVEEGLAGEALAQRLTELELFVHVMQDGDYVLVVDGETAHVGDLGDYYYVDYADNSEDGSCHRRGVTWLKSMPINLLGQELQQFLNASIPLAKYAHPVTDAQMEHWLAARPPEEREPAAFAIEEATLAEAVAILKQAMQSDDIERRERAAIAILQYASRSH